MKRWLIATVLVTGLLAVACGEDLTATPEATSPAPTSTKGASAAGDTSTVPTETPTSTAATVTSSIQNFTHQNLKIAAGTTVIWEHGDSARHTTTSGVPGDSDEGSLWNSGVLRQGESFNHTFSQVGTFQYFCQIHPTTMQATITVVETLDGQPAEAPASGTGGQVDYVY